LQKKAVRKIQKNPISWKNKKKKTKKSFFIFLYKECSIFISFWSAWVRGLGVSGAEKPPLPPNPLPLRLWHFFALQKKAVRKNRKTL
jgi:heme/copper-type cytochrome/quinol oxidase subunit 3